MGGARVRVMLLLVSLSVSNAATARLTMPGREDMERLVEPPALAPPSRKYINFRPLIGILSQACHSCPGK